MTHDLNQNHILKWGYEHFMSFHEKSRLNSMFSSKKLEPYYAVEISVTDKNVMLTVPSYDTWGSEKPSFGVDKPTINVPADSKYLRELAKALLAIADQFEKK